MNGIIALYILLVYTLCASVSSQQTGQLDYQVAKAALNDIVLERERRAIGGQEVTDGAWPWLVSLRGKVVTKTLFGFIPVSYSTIVCGGSVLNDRWILTAAHCFDGHYKFRHPRSWKIRLGTKNLLPTVRDKVKSFIGNIFDIHSWKEWSMRAQRIVIHPRYNASYGAFWENDIALVRLSESVPSGPRYDKIQRVTLPSNNPNFPRKGQICVAKGWGCTKNGGQVSKYASQIDMPILRKSVCSIFGHNAIKGSKLCAGYLRTNKGICKGDSGGPLVCREGKSWVQVGVSSFNSKWAPENYPAVFTRVGDYKDWIYKTVRQ